MPTSDVNDARSEGLTPRALYDAYAARVYALALRVSGDPDIAGEVVEQIILAFSNGDLSQHRGRSLDAHVIRATRDFAMMRTHGRQARSATASCDGSPESLVEAVFFADATIPELAQAAGLGEDEVRRRLCSGMASLRRRAAGSGD